MAPQHLGLANERASQGRTGDDCPRRRPQSTRVGDAIRAMHAQPDLRRPHPVERHPKRPDHEVVLSLLDVASAFPIDDDRGRAGRRVDSDVVPQVQGNAHAVETGSEICARRGNPDGHAVITQAHVTPPQRGWST